MRAIIIAGGLGTRLRPLTYNTPKVIVPVANIPFILHQVELIRQAGIKEIILNLHYLSDKIRKVLEYETRKGMKFFYSIEKSPLGTAGAVRNAAEFFNDEPLLILNGDILTDIDISGLIRFHRAKKAKATIALTRVDDPTTYGLVVTRSDRVIERFIEKPSWEQVTTNTINAGIYVIEPDVFRKVPFGIEYSFERQLFPDLLESGKPVYGCPTDAYWIDIGNPAKYVQAHRSILKGEVETLILGRQKKRRVWVGAGSKINRSARLYSPLIIGKDARIEKGASINAFSVIGDRVCVGEGTRIENAIIWSGTVIGKRANIGNCVIGFNCRIEDDAEVSSGVVLADGTILKRGSRLGVKF